MQLAMQADARPPHRYVLVTNRCLHIRDPAIVEYITDGSSILGDAHDLGYIP